MAGDLGATSGFVDRHWGTVQSATRRALRGERCDGDLHAEVVQETWAHLLRRDGRGRLAAFVAFEPARGSVRGRVWQKAFDRACELRRQRRRRWERERAPIDDGFEDWISDDDIDERHAKRQLVLKLAESIERTLTGRQWTVFCSMVFGELTGNEVAVELGISENAAHKAMSRARQRVEAVVERICDG